ncbi:Holliday junction branch migration protein RuvA [Hwanghaeella sp.]|uniref:Holliday junction branch migration protein RuvA n=1 Tax=Hwanghaeella sp. TaxID=2605943 RepID=UPI003CCBE725
MIARLKGLLDEVGDDWLIVDVGGVGYLVFCSARTLSRLPGRGEAVRLDIETHVREDHIHLYGFGDASERAWFKLLTGVQGVGAKVGLAILSVLSPEQLTQAVAAGDKAAIARANGVGPKLAGRIASELKDKVGALTLGAAAKATVAGEAGPVGGEAAPAGSSADDAVSALVNLGYGRSEAFGAVARVIQDHGADVPLGELVRLGLKELAQ